MNMSLQIFLRSFKQVIRSPARMSLIIGFPIFFIFIFAFIFGGGGFEETIVSVGIINLDESGPLISEWEDEFSNYTNEWIETDSDDINPFSTDKVGDIQ
ncbi:MAG: hypothetical protein ACW98F_20690 [Candidatus Hodarchaeales archaeon]